MSDSTPQNDPMDLAFIPELAPFQPDQRAWLNGYLAGLMAGKSIASSTKGDAPSPSLGSLLLLYGSQTGSAEGLARKFAAQARCSGLNARALALDAIQLAELTADTPVALLTSTYGDGEMPDNAQGFWDLLAREDAPRLEKLRYAVLALGDKNYVQFCEAGKKFDTRFENLGARRILPRKDCDTDYETSAAEWFAEFLKALGSAPTLSSEVSEVEGWSKSRPYPARLKDQRRLNGETSSKDTRHIEIDLGDSGLSYEVGDALGVLPVNDGEFVAEILEAAGLDGEEAVRVNETDLPLRKALSEHLDLSVFFAALPEKGVPASELIQPLRKLSPRLYSISSSPKAHHGEVHLTVGVVRYELNGRKCGGVCSTFLADRVGVETALPVFVQPSHGFKLPTDPATPIIMVGPGTGIAPFRAFLEERRSIGAAGRNWLFFGDQRAETDFLYREELAAMHQDGFLTRLDTAFSRDQAEKIYVQQRMLENSAELWSWLQEGAHFYVCGDAKRMAKDVDAALHEVAMKSGSLSADDAADYVKSLKSTKRYQRDVY